MGFNEIFKGFQLLAFSRPSLYQDRERDFPKHGYLASTVDAWTEWFNNHPDVVDKKLHDAQMSAMSELKKENARKDREIARKDKALADAATMLMLSKKAEAIWGAKES